MVAARASHRASNTSFSLQADCLGIGDHEVAAQEPDRVFRVVFFVTGARVAVAEFGPVVQLERAEQFGLHDLGPDAASDAGGIVEDQVPRRRPDVPKYRPQPVAETLCALT